MKLLWDSLFVLEDNWQPVLGILSLILLGQILVWVVMKLIFSHSLTKEEYFSLGMVGWILPASLISVLWYLLRTAGLLQFNIWTFIILLVFFAILLFFLVNKQNIQSSKAILLGLLLLFCTSILLRLAYISKANMPLYFDSARHYEIIKNLMVNSEPSNSSASFIWPTTAYYHIGFHFLTAFLAASMHMEITKTMLILGQMILAATPLSVFFIIKHETKSNSAGLFAVLLAGIGWSMPAYAVNWGKYPALTSLMLIQFVLGLAYLADQNRHTLTKQKNWSLYAMLALGIIISGFFHSRSLIMIAIAIVASVTAKWWQTLPRPARYLVFCLLLLGILLEIIFIRTHEILDPLFDPYGPEGLLVTIIVLFLSIFAQKTYPELAFSNILAIFLLLCSLFIPTVNIIPCFANLTLLDRPFVEMILYLPLSFLGGLGLAGLEQTLSRQQARFGKLRLLHGGTIGVLFIGLILGNALIQYESYPSDCCNIVSRDDLIALDWMGKNLPYDARILISANELIVQTSGSFQDYSPADAGAWITPLTSRVTIPYLYDTDLGQEKNFNSLCKMGIDYIYIGAIGQRFHAARLKSHPDWYKPLLSISRAEVYQVIGCG